MKAEEQTGRVRVGGASPGSRPPLLIVIGGQSQSVLLELVYRKRGHVTTC